MLYWEILGTKAYQDSWVSASWQLVRSSTDRARQGKAEDVPVVPRRALGEDCERGESLQYWKNRKMLSKAGRRQPPSLWTIGRKFHQELRGQAELATIQKAAPSLGERSNLEGQRRKWESFPKNVMCSLSYLIPLNFPWPKELIILVLILMLFSHFKKLSFLLIHCTEKT